MQGVRRPVTNPLTAIRFPIPFDAIRPEHVQPAIDHLLTEARQRQAAIAACANPGWENTLLALDVLTDKVDYAAGLARHIESVATTAEFRTAHNAIQAPLSAFYSNIPLDVGLWRTLQRFQTTEEAARLSGARARFFTKTLDAFRRHGAELEETAKDRLRSIDRELAEATTKFSENVLDATNAFELILTEEKDLAGLPPTAIQAARASAQARGVGGWRFTLQAPSYTAVMTYLDRRDIREHVYRAFVTRAAAPPFDNRELLRRILALRREKARLLGYRNFADFALADRMARDGETAQQFLERLRQRTEPRFHAENRELEEFRRSLEGPHAPPLQPWDVAYYAEKMRRALFDFDEEQLRVFFPLQRVFTGLLEIVHRLYGIRVKPREGVPVWDAAVGAWDIFDEDERRLGSFYSDWFPRENKRGGAWMDALITATPHSAAHCGQVGVICGNLMPPVGETPALLSHREVETIFHEFGHLLHHCLTRAELRSQAGTNVAWDFVELPSQIMENWCWEREALNLISGHWQTGEPLPDDLFQKMRQARTFRAANAQMRQLGFGILDLLLHRCWDESQDGDLLEYSRKILAQFSPTPLPPDFAMVASFTHLFSSPVGYAAGYYSYKWAEVLDADAFTRFQQEGIFNRQVGLAFRRSILEPGDSEDPAVLYRQFMGRDPDETALLIRCGLLEPPR